MSSAVRFLGAALIVLAALAAAGAAMAWALMVRMPGVSFTGEPEKLDARQSQFRDELARDVQRLAGTIGERNLEHLEAYRRAAAFIESELGAVGLAAKRESYVSEGVEVQNIIAEIAGRDRRSELVVVGAHYDSVVGSPGANDNASGVASLLALARALATSAPSRTLRFVAFANEEAPYFESGGMGSDIHARGAASRGETVVAMLSLETMGYYSEAAGSQIYPLGILGKWYPTTGDFIAFVGNVESRALVRRTVGSFRAATRFPSQGAALPGSVPGVGWSDHRSFWQIGAPAVMVTDTALFRYPHYHLPSDTADKLDYERLARVVSGLVGVIRHLAG